MNLYCFELRIRSVSKGGLRYVHRACFFLSKLPKDTDSERILDKVGGGSAEKGIFSRWKIDDLSLAMGCLYIETVRCSYDNKISNNVIHTNRWGDEKTISFTVSSVHSWSEMKKRLLSGVRCQFVVGCDDGICFRVDFFQAGPLKILRSRKYTGVSALQHRAGRREKF